MRRNLFWILLLIALGLGFLIAWVDSRPTWDDTGITAGAVFILAALLGMAEPEYAWLWALAVGGWIPVLGIALHHNFASILALLMACLGAYAGAFGRKAILALAKAG